MKFSLRAQFVVWWFLTRRMMQTRYKGSLLGIIWLVLLPVLMLAGYTFVFTQIFEPKWPALGQDGSVFGFAVILFAGLLVYGMFSEVILRSGQIVPSHAVFIKKIRFPSALIPVALVSESLIYMFIGLLVLIGFMFVVGLSPSWTAVWVPVILLPFAILMLGLSYFLSAIGTYVKDVNFVLTPIVTLALFLAPILYPSTAIPEAVRDYLYLNPISAIAEALHQSLIFGEAPDFAALSTYSLVAILILCAGYAFFSRAKGGFSDVL